MRKFVWSLALVVSAVVVARVPAQEVIQLPEDGGLWHTTLILPSNPASDAASQRLVQHFAKSPRLQRLSAQTMVHRYSPSDPLFEARYAPYFGGVLPALLIQKADGAVVYKISGQAIPQFGEQLADEIAQAIDQCCPLRPRPQPQPQPSPTPEPDSAPQLPAVNVEIIPDIRPQNEQESPAPSESTPTAPLSPLLLLAPIVAGALGLRRESRRDF